MTNADLAKAAKVVRARLAGLGLTGAVTLKPKSDLLVVRIDGTDHVSATATRLLTASAQLMLFDFEADLGSPSKDAKGNPVASPSLYGLLTHLQHRTNEPPQAYYLFGSRTTSSKAKRLLKGPASTMRGLLLSYGGKTPADTMVLTVPAHDIIVVCRAADGCLGATASSATYYYALEYVPRSTAQQGSIPELNGADLVPSGTHADVGPVGNPIVLLQLTDHGAKAFVRVTRAEAQRGAAKYRLAGKHGNYLDYVQHFAVVLDGIVRSTPYIDFRRNPNGIRGRNIEIDMGRGASLRDAKNLAIVLQSGGLPFRLEVVSERRG